MIDLDATPLDGFAAHMAKDRALGIGTRELYHRIARRFVATRGLQSPQKWLDKRIDAFTARGTATSVVPAVRRFIEYVEGPQGVAAIEWPRLADLPDRPREGLPPEHLDRYLAIVDEGEGDAGERLQHPTLRSTRCILRLLPRTGLRIAEVCGLDWSRIEHRRSAHRGTPRPGLLVLGKGRKVRWVPLMDEAVAVLDDYQTPRVRPADGPMFPSPRDGDSSLTPQTIRMWLRKWVDLRTDDEIAEGADPVRVSPHILRHTWATRAIASGVPLEIVRIIMGHKSITTTQRYVSPGTDDLADAMGKVSLSFDR